MLKVLILLSCLVASILCVYIPGDTYGYPVGGSYMNGGLSSMLRRPYRGWGRRDYDSDFNYGNSWYGNSWDSDLDNDMDNLRYLRGRGY